MLIELPHGRGPGMWRRVILDEFGDRPRWSAIIQCPECSALLPIPNHVIADNGQVTPSVGHPVATACTWHVTPKLIGWAPCPTAPDPKPFYQCEGCPAKSRQLSGWGVCGRLFCPQCLKVRFPGVTEGGT